MITYKLDPTHSSITFSIKHMMIAKVRGSFDKFDAKLVYDKNALEKSSAEATIEAASINTREEQRDTHLKSADFFDVEAFPSLTFKSVSVSSAGGELKVTGNLTVKDVTKEVVLTLDGPTDELKDPYGNLKIGVSATTTVKRKDFGLNWNAALEAGGVLVGDDVSIVMDLQFIRE